MKQFLLYLICIAFYTSTRGNAVEFLSFTAVQQSEAINIDWTTATENNTDYFSIERGIDTINFTVIGTVIASGNSTSLLMYNYTDYGPFAYNQCYIYRLKAVYFDSSYEYISNYIGICYQELMPQIDTFNILYPNPFFDNALIAFKEINVASEINVYLYDIMGNMVLQNTLYISGTNLTVGVIIKNETLKKGIYFLVIYNGDEKIYSDKLISL